MDDKQLAALMTGLESERVERTAPASLDKESKEKINKAICAFANDLPGSGEPGFVFIGVNDDGSCANIGVDDDLLKRLSEFRSTGKILPQPMTSVYAKTLNDCRVAVVEVAPAYQPPVLYDGRCWIRVGPTTREANAEEERRLFEKQQQHMTFDMREVYPHVDMSDLDLSYFKNNYLPKAIAADVLAQNNRTTEHQMRTLRVLSHNNHPNNAAILCFSAVPLYWLPYAYTQFARFDGVEILSQIILDQREVKSSIFHQIEAIESLLSLNITRPMDLSGSRHVVHPNYPLDALKQYLRNAVMHRDYESPAPIRIHWFSDRIEIISPGELYGSANIAKRHTSYRNPVIAEALRVAGLVEHFGLGIPLAEEAMGENGNPPPEYDIDGGHFRVVLRPAQQTAAREH